MAQETSKYIEGYREVGCSLSVDSRDLIVDFIRIMSNKLKLCAYCNNLAIPDKDVCKKCQTYLEEGMVSYPLPAPLNSPEVKCECGSSSLNSPNHSHYCPLFSPT